MSQTLAIIVRKPPVVTIPAGPHGPVKSVEMIIPYRTGIGKYVRSD